MAETPMLRLLGFPPGVYISLLLAIACLILTALQTSFHFLGLLWNQSAMYKRTANLEHFGTCKQPTPACAARSPALPLAAFVPRQPLVP